MTNFTVNGSLIIGCASIFANYCQKTNSKLKIFLFPWLKYFHIFSQCFNSQIVFYGFIQILLSPCWTIKVVASLKLSSHTNGVVMLHKSHRLGSSCSFMATERIGDWCIGLHKEIWALPRSTGAMEIHKPRNWLRAHWTRAVQNYPLL